VLLLLLLLLLLFLWPKNEDLYRDIGVFSARSDRKFVRLVDDDERADPEDLVAGNDIDGRSRFLVENLCFDMSICLNGYHNSNQLILCLSRLFKPAI
jgi:hypothetical protein